MYDKRRLWNVIGHVITSSSQQVAKCSQGCEEILKGTDAQQSSNALAVASLSLIGLKSPADETEASLRKQAYYGAGVT